MSQIRLRSYSEIAEELGKKEEMLYHSYGNADDYRPFYIEQDFSIDQGGLYDDIDELRNELREG